MLTEAEVQTVAEKILRDKLGSFGFQAAEVHAGFDHDGESALFVEAKFAPNAPLLAGRESSEALVALSKALLKRNEQRFPYLSLRYPDDERPEDDEDEAPIQSSERH
jgi:hypothetical protein